VNPIKHLLFILRQRRTGTRVSFSAYLKGLERIELGSGCKIHADASVDASRSAGVSFGDKVTLNRFAYVQGGERRRAPGRPRRDQQLQHRQRHGGRRYRRRHPGRPGRAHHLLPAPACARRDDTFASRRCAADPHRPRLLARRQQRWSSPA
jgi:hypothetical protein